MLKRETHLKITAAYESYIEDKLKSKVQEKSDRNGVHFLKKGKGAWSNSERGTGHFERLLG